jgi:predicted SprT family Zn-dependent metalloprotease
MNGKRKIKLSIVGLILILFGILSYEFLCGKLFSFTPIIIGFSKHELPNTIIYVQNGNGYNDFVKIDTLIPTVENFHESKFLYKPKIFIFKESSSYIQRSLSTKPRFITYPNSRIFISPWALKESFENKISLEIYLRHELSHSLIFQQSGIINAYKYPKWLLEGIAVYSSNQMGTFNYPSKQETYILISQGHFMPPDYFRTNNESKINLDMGNSIGFIYSEFACIVDYLVVTYGKEKFISYMKILSENTDNNKVFKDVYGVDFLKEIQNFKKYVSENEKPI